MIPARLRVNAIVLQIGNKIGEWRVQGLTMGTQDKVIISSLSYVKLNISWGHSVQRAGGSQVCVIHLDLGVVNIWTIVMP